MEDRLHDVKIAEDDDYEWQAVIKEEDAPRVAYCLSKRNIINIPFVH